MKIMIFVKTEYVQDAQAYVNDKLCNNIQDNNKGWKDAFGPMLVATFNGDSMEEAKNFAIQMFPNADPEVFMFQRVS